MPLTTTALHRIITVHGEARREASSLAACPRRKAAIELEQCLSCPYLMAFETRPGDEHLLCVTEEKESVASEANTVGRFMSRDVVCLRPDVTIESAAAVFVQRNVGGFPVVDENRRVVGFISKTDVVQALAKGRFHDDLDTFDVDAPVRPARVVGDLMTPLRLSLRESDRIEDAAQQLATRGVHHAPVVSEDGRVIGILTSFDLLRAVASPVRPELEDCA